jgi:hypothetical protein
MNRLVIAAVLLAIPAAARANDSVGDEPAASPAPPIYPAPVGERPAPDADTLADEPPPPPAPAEPPPFVDHPTLAGGTHVSLDHFLNGALMLEGMIPLPRLPIAIHASASTGGSVDADNGGDFWRMTVGVEARQCSDVGNCTFVGLDLGFQHQTWADDDPSESEEHQGPVIAGRIGVDVGGEHVRFRGAFEIYRYRREFVDQMTTTQYGGGFTMALAYRL